MAQLRSLSDFNQTFQELITNIINFEGNIENTIFNENANLTAEENFQEAENVYQLNSNMIVNLTTLSENDDLPPNLRQLVEHNMNVLYQRENNLITHMIRLKKRIVNEREYREYKTEMDARRHETPEQRIQREYQEMLEEAREERRRAEELNNQTREERRQAEELNNQTRNLQEQMRRQMEELPTERLNRIEERLMRIETQMNTQNQQNIQQINGVNSRINQIQSQMNSQNQQNTQRINEIDSRTNQIQTQMNNNLTQYVKKSQLSNTVKYDNLNLDLQEYIQIEEWTNRKIDEIVFDSNIHNWSQNTSEFDDKIFNRSNLLFVMEDKSGNKFLGYVDAKIDKYRYWENGEWKGERITDSKAFIFSLQSNGRLPHPMKFNIKEEKKDWAFILFKKDHESLFQFGGVEFVIKKENYKNQCYCLNQNVFDFQGYSNALRGEIGEDKKFTVNRFTVIQMK